jgi:hypothetical protein
MKTDVGYIPRLEMFCRQIGGGAAAQNIIFHEKSPVVAILSAAHPEKSDAAISLSLACLTDKNNENIGRKILVLLEGVDK